MNLYGSKAEFLKGGTSKALSGEHARNRKFIKPRKAQEEQEQEEQEQEKKEEESARAGQREQEPGQTQKKAGAGLTKLAGRLQERDSESQATSHTARTYSEVLKEGIKPRHSGMTTRSRSKQI